ncbi:hypothetical protein [Microbacterium sp. cf332]|uniref:hypothetical protein n=1 Tax=Microbacterium sp. cf332 TaxID=1761804 RepID=UPI00088596FA|nr:hypothetical protein [Microbacterium sp. cf332]SDQ95635.1 hypothetical protein SAMN04487847_3036 [Microbacterium sp. cf332]
MTTSARRHRTDHDADPSWWRREHGGLPGWGLAAMLAAIVATSAFSLAMILQA